MQNDNFMKKCIIAMAIFLLIFTIIMIVCFFVVNDVPDALIIAVFGACLGEGSICGFLKKAKINNEKIEDDPDDEKEDVDDGSCELD